MKAALSFALLALAVASASPVASRAASATLSYYSDSACTTLVKTVNLPSSVCQTLEDYPGVIFTENLASVTLTQVAEDGDCRGQDTKPASGECVDNSAYFYHGAYWALLPKIHEWQTDGKGRAPAEMLPICYANIESVGARYAVPASDELPTECL